MTNELYIAEAEDRGLLLKTYKEFLDDNILTMHSIAWFPLREEYSKKFDSKKAWEWTKKRVGQKYGDSQAQLADSWEETTLKMLSGAGSVEEYIENIRQAMLDMLEGSSDALK